MTRRSTTLAPAGVALAVLLLAPLGAAELSVSMEFVFDTPRRMQLTMETTVNGSEAAGFRQAFDRDQDGNVSQAESDQAQGFFTATAGGAGLDNDTFRMDGKNASESRVQSWTLSNLTGPTTSEDPVFITLVQNFTYPVDPGRSHRLTFRESERPDDEPDNASSGVGSNHLSLVAPAGYIITDHQTPLNLTLSDDRRRLSGDQLDGDLGSAGGSYVVFTREGADDEGTPGPAWWVAAGALGLAGALQGARARRR